MLGRIFAATEFKCPLLKGGRVTGRRESPLWQGKRAWAGEESLQNGFANEPHNTARYRASQDMMVAREMPNKSTRLVMGRHAPA